MLKPSTAARVERKQEVQKATHDARAKPRSLDVGETVFVKNHGEGEKWLPGVITKCTGPVSFHVKLNDGRERCCHQDQLRSRFSQVDPELEEESETPTAADNFDLNLPPAAEVVPVQPTPTVTTPAAPDPTPETVAPSGTMPEGPPPGVTPDVQTTGQTPEGQSPQSVPPRKTYPQRNRTARQWYEPGQN